MSDIQVGDFVRTKDGRVYQVNSSNDEWALSDIFYKVITKHSPDLIDLIEVEDLAKVLDKGSGNEEIVHIFDKSMIQAIKEDIKNGEFELIGICTHQQFNSVMYKVKE